MIESVEARRTLASREETLRIFRRRVEEAATARFGLNGRPPPPSHGRRVSPAEC